MARLEREVASFEAEVAEINQTSLQRYQLKHSIHALVVVANAVTVTIKPLTLTKTFTFPAALHSHQIRGNYIKSVVSKECGAAKRVRKRNLIPLLNLIGVSIISMIKFSLLSPCLLYSNVQIKIKLLRFHLESHNECVQFLLL